MDRWEYEVVVSSALGDDTVGVVRRHDGSFLFPSSMTSRGGLVLTDFRPHGQRIDGRTVVAGRRPPGVERVVVIDDRGDEHEAVLAEEAWIAVAGDAGYAEPLARYEDADGALVPFPLPDGERTRVEDAEAPCPICANTTWIEIEEYVHCDRCGLQAGPAMSMILFDSGDLGPDDDEDDEPDEDDWEAEARRERAAALASARFPVYGVTGWDFELRGWGGDPDDDEGVRSASLDHADGERSVQVDSSRGERRADDDWLRERLMRLGGTDPWTGCATPSHAALRVHIAHAERIARRRTAHTERVLRDFVIDGEPEPFAFIALGDAWVAHRDHYGVTVELSGRGVDPGTIELAPVAGSASGAERARRAAAGELLTRAEVEALIDEHGHGDRREEILAGIRPGYRLTAEPGSPHRIGGEPDLAPGERWPHTEDGIPFTFLAQIDCSQLPVLGSEFPLPAWNHGGRLLRFFTALDGQLPEPSVAVALACDPAGPLTRTPVPPRPDPMPADAWEPDDDYLRELEELPVRLVPFLTTDQDTYENPFAEALLASGVPRYGDEHVAHDAQLLGHTTNVQGEDPTTMGQHVYEDTGEDDWCLLLHLLPEIGDGGDLSILIPYEDLAAGRYDRLATDISMN